MDIWQAAILALFCYLGALTTPWVFGTTGGWYVITRPLVAGLISGIVLGDITTGVIIGVVVQAPFIGLITPGGVVPADLSFVSYLGIPLALAAGAEPAVAVSLSVGFGIIGVVAWQLLSVGNSFWAHRADRFAEQADLDGIIRVNYYAQIGTFLLRGVLPFFILWLGAGVAQNLVIVLQEQVPWFTEFLGVVGGALPAVGIAILILQIAPVPRQLMWFAVGWVLFVYLGVPVVGIAVIGGLVAIIYYRFLYEQEEAREAAEV
jgi:mannose PTS system EIIC component